MSKKKIEYDKGDHECDSVNVCVCVSFQSFPHTSNLCVLEARYHGALGIYQVPEYAIIFYVLGGKGAWEVSVGSPFAPCSA